ncbi:MAG: cytidine deaminase [Bacilli bacterium]|nr:cytidine deaminase [Bacilli bacterium]
MELQEDLLKNTDYAKINYLSNEEIEKLEAEALKYYNNAYTPYSHFHVGASLLLNDGTIYGGCNIENASYGLSNCAERTVLFKLYSEGYTKNDIKALLIIGETNDAISPCGACRQVMSELMNLNTLVVLTNLNHKRRYFSVKELLPYNFSQGDLNV